METKHTFFKRAIRSAQNFVNVTKTLSETHQLNQAYLSSGVRLYDIDEPAHDCMPFDSKLFADAVVKAVSHCRQLIGPLQCCSSVTVKGTKYCKDSVVVINYVESMPSFAKVILCLLDAHGKYGLLVKNLKSEKHNALGLYVVADNENAECFKCVLIDDLWDYCPLPSYSVNGLPHIALKHALYDCMAQ